MTTSFLFKFYATVPATFMLEPLFIIVIYLKATGNEMAYFELNLT